MHYISKTLGEEQADSSPKMKTLSFTHSHVITEYCMQLFSSVEEKKKNFKWIFTGLFHTMTIRVQNVQKTM